LPEARIDLGWFHIGKKFQTEACFAGDSFEDSLEAVNGTCGMACRGEPYQTRDVLNISDDEKCSKLKGLYNYLKQNQNYIISMKERKRLERPLRVSG